MSHFQERKERTGNNLTLGEMKWISTNKEFISRFTKEKFSEDLLETIAIDHTMGIGELEQKCLELLTYIHWEHLPEFAGLTPREVLQKIQNVQKTSTTDVHQE